MAEALETQTQLQVMEGSQAMAEAVRLCRPHVICAYPITPQTHIVEFLAQMVAEGRLASQFVTVESEHSAASVCLGASATGARTYTSTSSQGLALMAEVVYNIAGLRLPVVMGLSNRALSAPLSIWNDHQDSMMVRDSGCIQLFAEDAQEAADLHIQAYRIGEDHRVLLPVMVCHDGFILTHVFEPVAIPRQEEVDAFLPPYDPPYRLDPRNPMTFGCFSEPRWYMEVRYEMHRALERAQEVIEEVARDFGRAFGRYRGGLVEAYRLEGARVAFIALGSLMTTIKDFVDDLRAQGEPVGALRLRSYRPFPSDEIYGALEHVDRVVVVEKALSLGAPAILASEVRSAFYSRHRRPQVSAFIAGLGGRDITKDTLRGMMRRAEAGPVDMEFVDLNRALLGDD